MTINQQNFWIGEGEVGGGWGGGDCDDVHRVSCHDDVVQPVKVFQQLSSGVCRPDILGDGKKKYLDRTSEWGRLKDGVSPVTALVVAGKLSRSPLTAVTPMPYSVPGFRPANIEKKSCLKRAGISYLSGWKTSGWGPSIKCFVACANG